MSNHTFIPRILGVQAWLWALLKGYKLSFSLPGCQTILLSIPSSLNTLNYLFILLAEMFF